MARATVDMAALVRAWRSHAAAVSLSYATPHWLKDVIRPHTCGHCRVSLSFKSRSEVASCAQRLGELLRLLATAARGGPDVFQLLQEYSSACPYLTCAWCDDADNDAVLINVRVFGGVEEPKLLKEALFDWSETASVVSREYIALRDALQALVAARQPRPRSRADKKIGVSLALAPRILTAQDVLVYAEHTDQLLRAIATADSQKWGFYVQQLTFDATNVYVTPRELSPMLTTLLRHPVPVALDPYYTRHVNISTLTEACAPEGTASLEYLTEMVLELDQVALEDDATMRRFCELVTTQCHRLEQLTLVGSSGGDVQVQRRTLPVLGAVLLAPRRLEYLSLDRLWLQDAAMESLVSAVAQSSSLRESSSLKRLKIMTSDMAMLVPSSVEQLTASRPWSWEALLQFLLEHPSLRELALSSIGNTYSQTERTDAAEAQLAAADGEQWPALTKLHANYDSTLMMTGLLANVGESLTEISLSSTRPGSSRAMLQAIVEHCPRLSRLTLTDFELDDELVEILAAACDTNCVDLRKLSINKVNKSIAVACVRLLQILSDPRRRLTQTLEELSIFTTQQAFSVVRQATDLMLRCNSRLVCVDIEQSEDSDEDEDDEDVDDEEEEEEEEDSDDDDEEEEEESSDDDEEDESTNSSATDHIKMNPVQLLLDQMAVAADGKTALQKNELLPEVVILPSMRRRAALLSVLVARNLQLPEPLVVTVLAMAGRRALRY